MKQDHRKVFISDQRYKSWSELSDNYVRTFFLLGNSYQFWEISEVFQIHHFTSTSKHMNGLSSGLATFYAPVCKVQRAWNLNHYGAALEGRRSVLLRW